MAIICTDGKKLPWENSQSNLGRLFLQFKNERKPMLISGSGVSILAYYCATGYHPIRVINGEEKGGTLSLINRIPKNEAQLLENDEVYLDNATGDLYNFQKVF